MSIVKPQITTRAVVQNGVQAYKQALRPIRIERFTPETIKDPEKHAAQMTRLVQAIEAESRAARSQPRLRAITFEKKAVGSGPTNLFLKHGYGQTRVRWAVVWWLADDGATAHNLQYNQTYSTEDTLVLTSYVAGLADIEVWPVI